MIFKGLRALDEVIVTVSYDDGAVEELDPAYDQHIYTPDSFDWGADTKGAHQLALAIAVEMNRSATGLYSLDNQADLLTKILVKLPNQKWVLTEEQIMSVSLERAYDNDRCQYS